MQNSQVVQAALLMLNSYKEPMRNDVEERRVLVAIDQYFSPAPAEVTRTTVMFGPYQGLAERTAPIVAEMGRLGLVLSGGAINCVFANDPIKDLDFYMKDPSKKSEVIEFLAKYFPSEHWVSGNAFTMKRHSVASRKKWTVQLITRFHGTPQDILDTFDFTITQGLYDFETKQFVFGDRFLQDIASRTLIYLGKSHFPICAMYRTKKYQDRGYKLPGATIMHIALSIVRLEIKTYKQLKEQLMGVDTQYLAGLLNSAKYQDELPIDYGQFLVDAFEHIDGVTYAEDETKF